MPALACSNTIPGTIRERGLHVWMQAGKYEGDWWAHDELHDVRP